MGFKSAFLPYTIKRTMLADVAKELKSFRPLGAEGKTVTL